MNEIAVSVYCLVYNHEKYLRQCLDGFIMQKTNFKFEVIVHDDASTDGSADIIREYEQKYPEIIKPIYQTVNQYSQGIPIAKTYILPRMRGKYVAVCEGDDYWCDENKLQLQFDAMEANPDCHFCVHKVQHILGNGQLLDKYNPSFMLEEGSLTSRQFMSLYGITYPFQTSSYFMRRDDRKAYCDNPPDFVTAADVGDEPTMLYLAIKGNTYYIDKVMSCYRECSVSSWNISQKKSSEKRVKHCDSMIAMWGLFNRYTNYEYDAIVQKNICDYTFQKCELCIEDRKYARMMLQHKYWHYLQKRSLKYKLFVLLRATISSGKSKRKG